MAVVVLKMNPYSIKKLNQCHEFVEYVAGDNWSCKRRFSLVAPVKELKGLRFDSNGTHGARCGSGYYLVPNIYF